MLANRLSADGETRVLVLEAGPKDSNPFIHLPVGNARILPNTSYNWCFWTEPDGPTQERPIPLPRGKMLGGSSSLNGMLYVRGQASDYDAWRQMGLDGWDYDSLLPLFRRSEGNGRGEDEFHGSQGPLKVNNDISDNPLFDAFHEAGRQAGYRENNDFNGAGQEGFGRYQFTAHRGRRCSAADAFLRPALGRSNLTLQVGALAERIIIEGGRAVGIAYSHRGAAKTARAAREVVLSGGAINSPQLLMLSGIGDADHLVSMDIPIQVDLPGVGQNLQDHLGVRLLHLSKLKTVTQTLGRLDLAAISVIRAWITGRGPAAQFPLVGGAFLRTDPSLTAPDLQLQFCAGNLLTMSRNPFARAARDNSRPDTFTLLICQLRPHSRGELRLKSNDPSMAPMIRPGYLSDPYDLEVTRKGIKLTRDILAQPAITQVSHGEFLPGADIASDADIDSFIAETGSTVHHPVGTCRMGNDTGAVLDAELRVRGVEGLRVADASIMPNLISGNTNAPSIMIGEKAAQLITGD